LIEFYETGQTELYNLKEDLGETKNLAVSMKQKVDELRDDLDAWPPSYDKYGHTWFLERFVRTLA